MCSDRSDITTKVDIPAGFGRLVRRKSGAEESQREKSEEMGKELEFEPAEQVEFKGKFEDPTTAEVKVKNETGKRMVYKVKCSDNDLFKIRPVMGIVKEGESATVTLTFTAKDKGKAPKDANHHFSLYQGEPKEDQKSARKFWEEADSKKIKRHKKIKVAFTEGAAEDKKEEKKEEKKEDKKEEEKKEDDKKEEKKEDEKKDEDKKEEKKEDEKKDDKEEKKEEEKKE